MKNKQKMYYSLLNEEKPVYEMDIYFLYPMNNLYPNASTFPGAVKQIKYIEIDGVQVPVETGNVELVYDIPIFFKGNITMSGGESNIVEYGIDKSEYDAIIIMQNGELPITETSLIWLESPVVYKDVENKIVDANSADYRVKKVSPSLNQTKYLLERIVK